MNRIEKASRDKAHRLTPRTLFQWTLAVVLSASGLVATVTGIYFLFVPSGGYQGGRNPDYGLTFLFSRDTWLDIHTWSGVAMVVLGIIHLALHWRWLAEMLKRTGAVLLGRRKPFPRAIWVRMLVVMTVGVLFLAVVASSLYFLFNPGGGHEGAGGTAGFILSRADWNQVHTWAAIAFIGAAAAHLAMRWKWLARVTPTVLRVHRPAEASAR